MTCARAWITTLTWSVFFRLFRPTKPASPTKHQQGEETLLVHLVGL